MNGIYEMHRFKVFVNITFPQNPHPTVHVENAPIHSPSLTKKSFIKTFKLPQINKMLDPRNLSNVSAIMIWRGARKINRSLTPILGP